MAFGKKIFSKKKEPLGTSFSETCCFRAFSLTALACCSEKTYIRPAFRRAFLSHFLFLWLELKSMVTQLRNVDLSSKVHSEEGIKQIPNKRFNNSNNHVEWWLQYYQNQARPWCQVVYFCSEAISSIGKGLRWSLNCLAATYWLSTGGAASTVRKL